MRERVRSRRRQEYRRAILDAAEEVFGQSGYGATKMSAIASAAGVAIGTLYNYFDSKEAVFSALLERAQAEMLERISAAGPKALGLARVEAIVRETLVAVEERGRLFAVQIEAVGAAAEGAMDLEAHQQSYFIYVGLLRDAIEHAITHDQLRGDIDPGTLAFSLAGSCRAFMFNWMISGRSHSLQEQAGTILELFVKGAQPT